MIFGAGSPIGDGPAFPFFGSFPGRVVCFFSEADAFDQIVDAITRLTYCASVATSSPEDLSCE